jgi:membrane protein required for colicin V production
MNPFDMIVVVALVYFIIIGLLRGSIREISSIAALLGGFYFAYLYYEPFARVFSLFIQTEYIKNIAAFLVLFCSVAIGVTLAGTLLRAFTKLVLLGVVDRLMGGVIGALKAVIVLSVVHFLALTFLPAGGAAIVAQSRMAPAINNTASVIVYLIPESFKRDMTARAQKLRWQWETRQSEPPDPGE